MRGRPVTTAEVRNIERWMKDLVSRFDENGELTEADLDKFGIRNDEHEKPGDLRRDERVIHQRRALLFMHDKVLEKEKAKKDGITSKNKRARVAGEKPVDLPSKRSRRAKSN